MKVTIEQVPNILTVARVLLIPVFFFSFYIDNYSNIISALIFLLASLTDFFDGYLARKYNAQSRFGKLFDPIADKMIVATALIMLTATHKISGLALIPATVILCREFFISGVREYFAKSQQPIAVNNYGKAKTATQMIAIIILLLSSADFFILRPLGLLLLWASAILSVISSYQYLKAKKIKL